MHTHTVSVYKKKSMMLYTSPSQNKSAMIQGGNWDEKVCTYRGKKSELKQLSLNLSHVSACHTLLRGSET